MFWRLTIAADDFGRFPAHITALIAACFPLMVRDITDKRGEAMLAELVAVDLVRLYEVEGKRYGFFPTWEKYQQRRAKYSKYPQPPASEIICKQMQSNVLEESRSEERGSEESRSDLKPSQTQVSTAEPESGSTEAAAPPDKPAAPEWPEDDRWLLRFLDTEQQAFNGHHLPTLRDPAYWNTLSSAINGIPALGVMQAEFAKMKLWLENHRSRAPTPRGTRRFVANWLEQWAEKERRKRA